MFSNSCAVCESEGVFQVEDLPVGTRKFCSEKCFTEYTGLPAKPEGHYGLSKPSTRLAQMQNAENKGRNKINPIEKAGISGVASGATIEGLSALMGAETLTGYRSKTDKRQMLDELAHSIYKKELTSEKVFPGIRVSSKVVLYPDGDTKKERDLSRFQMSMKYSDRMVHQCDNCGIWATSKQTNNWEKDKSREGKKNEIVYYQKDVVNPSEYFGYCVKCYDNLSEKGQLGSNPFSAEEEPPEKDDPLESWMEDYDAEESAYWFLKGEMQSRAPLTEMDLEQIMEMLQNVPAKEMNEAIEQADMMGDEAAMIVLIMANNKRKFREQFASEGLEEVSAYFANLKSKNPDLARKIEYSVKNEDDIPRKEIEEAGFDEDIIEEWVDYIAVEDESLQPYESCPSCEGEGWILTSYTPATRYDPADGDGEDCEECVGTGMIDPADYMDKEGQYYAESFEAESNGDRQLEESIKRTKMSAVRTGLAITTFGIVLWNLWTNKKQEKQISDIMGLV